MVGVEEGGKEEEEEGMKQEKCFSRDLRWSWRRGSGVDRAGKDGCHHTSSPLPLPFVDR
ncbi:hypothetical protein COCNU_scaffold009680G000010 [Cocos nucifera]|nr:hypothetical protein [Cocos nucifera]